MSDNDPADNEAVQLTSAANDASGGKYAAELAGALKGAATAVAIEEGALYVGVVVMEGLALVGAVDAALVVGGIVATAASIGASYGAIGACVGAVVGVIWAAFEEAGSTDEHLINSSDWYRRCLQLPGNSPRTRNGQNEPLANKLMIMLSTDEDSLKAFLTWVPQGNFDDYNRTMQGFFKSSHNSLRLMVQAYLRFRGWTNWKPTTDSPGTVPLEIYGICDTLARINLIQGYSYRGEYDLMTKSGEAIGHAWDMMGITDVETLATWHNSNGVTPAHVNDDNDYFGRDGEMYFALLSTIYLDMPGTKASDIDPQILRWAVGKGLDVKATLSNTDVRLTVSQGSATKSLTYVLGGAIAGGLIAGPVGVLAGAAAGYKLSP